MSDRHTVAFRYEDVDADSRAKIEQGVVALARINKHENFQNWMTIGAAYIEMQHAAMRLAHVNQPKGGGYNVAYAAIVAANPDLDVSKHRPPEQRRLDSTTATHASWMAHPERRLDIEAWHAALPDGTRQAVNHPSTVKRRYERYEKEHAAPKIDDGTGTPKPAATGLKAEVGRLQEDLDAANAKLQQLARGQDNLTEGRDWTWHDSDDDIAAIWLRLQPTKVVRIASKVLQLVKSTTQKPKKRAGVNREPAGERNW